LRERLSRYGVGFAVGFTRNLDGYCKKGIALTADQTQAVLGLLESTIPSRVATISQGVLVAMIMEKVKWSLLAFATTSLVLLAAGSSLLAVAGPGQEKARPDPNVRAKTAETKHAEPTQPQGPAKDPAAKAGVRSETQANELELNRVRAEMLEMETESIKGTLRTLMGSIGQAGIDPNEENLPEEIRKSNENWRHKQQERLLSLQDTYTEKRMQLARLKRQIANGSGGADQPGNEQNNLEDMSQRIRNLETKVDRILDRLSRNSR
jgi:hypothetical protein